MNIETRRIEKIEVKLTPAEKLQIKEDSDRMGQTMAHYARSLLLHERTETKHERSEIPAQTVPPDAPPRQTEADEVERFKEPENVELRRETSESLERQFQAKVARNKLNMGTKAAEAQAKKEMGVNAGP